MGVEKNKYDIVENPKHYNFGNLQPIQVMRDWDPIMAFYFCIGNVIKYSCRYKHKGAILEDIKKINWYSREAEDIAKELAEGGVNLHEYYSH